MSDVYFEKLHYDPHHMPVPNLESYALENWKCIIEYFTWVFRGVHESKIRDHSESIVDTENTKHIRQWIVRMSCSHGMYLFAMLQEAIILSPDLKRATFEATPVQCKHHRWHFLEPLGGRNISTVNCSSNEGSRYILWERGERCDVGPRPLLNRVRSQAVSPALHLLQCYFYENISLRFSLSHTARQLRHSSTAFHMRSSSFFLCRSAKCLLISSIMVVGGYQVYLFHSSPLHRRHALDIRAARPRTHEVGTSFVCKPWQLASDQYGSFPDSGKVMASSLLTSHNTPIELHIARSIVQANRVQRRGGCDCLARATVTPWSSRTVQRTYHSVPPLALSVVPCYSCHHCGDYTPLCDHVLLTSCSIHGLHNGVNLPPLTTPQTYISRVNIRIPRCEPSDSLHCEHATAVGGGASSKAPSLEQGALQNNSTSRTRMETFIETANILEGLEEDENLPY
ncbi:hypothetical protein J6590_047511 [Homalodisca vitripennis]|nr:hypothetical protein J6590_047511 [Homalodisca vitripennis]